MNKETSITKTITGKTTDEVPGKLKSLEHENLRQVPFQATPILAEKLVKKTEANRESSPTLNLESHLQTVEGNFQRLQENLKESEEICKNVFRKHEAEIRELIEFKTNHGEQDVTVLKKQINEQAQTIAELSKWRQNKIDTEDNTRLSKLMDDRLSDENPDIADLRPTKIAERFQELYDNPWTDAYEKAEKIFPNLSEQRLTKLLITLLIDVNTFCKRKFERHETDLTNALKRIPNQNYKPPEKILNQAKAYWRLFAEDCVESLLQEYLTADVLKVGPVQRLANETKDFTKECIAVCWLMVHQDPPVTFHLNVVRGEKFDSNLYKAYTKSGSTVDYVVWPALLLHEGGATLAKGVVQCRDAAEKPTGTDGQLHVTHKPNIKYELNEFSSDKTAHNKQPKKGSAVRERYNLTSMKVKYDLLSSLKPGGTSHEMPFDTLLKQPGFGSSGSSSTPDTCEPYGAAQTNGKTNAASETKGYSLSHQLHLQQPNTSVPSQNQQHYEFDPLYSANVSNSQNFGGPSFPASNQQQATTNKECISWSPTTDQQQGHNQYFQTVTGGIQQPAMAQAKSRPSEQYPQTLVPTEVEMKTYYSYLEYYGYNETAKHYVDWKIGKGVFDKCDQYIRWLQSLRGNYQ